MVIDQHGAGLQDIFTRNGYWNHVINLQSLLRLFLRWLRLDKTQPSPSIGAARQLLPPSLSVAEPSSCADYERVKFGKHSDSGPNLTAALTLPDLSALLARPLKYPIDMCLDPEEDQYRDATELHRAVALGNLAAVRRLVETGVDINALATPTLSQLLYMPDYKRAYSLSPLFVAAINGQVDIVKYLINEGADLQLYLRPHLHEGQAALVGMTALIVAARANRPEVVDLLLLGGVDVDGRDLHGATALVWAAFDGHLVVVKRLLAAGADINARLSYCRANRWGPAYENGSALFMAADQRRGDVVDFLTSIGAEKVGDTC